MQDIGKRLKEKRESLNVGLEEISLAIKINTKILQALEDGDMSKLPAKPFVRGFVQSYAKYLGLDVKEIMELFHNTQGTTKPQIPNSSTRVEESKSVETSLPGSGRNILVTIGIALAIIVIVVLQQFLAQREKEMQTDNVQAINGSDMPITIKSSSPGPGDSDSTEKENVLAPLQSPSPSTHTLATLPTSTPTATPTPTPTPKPSPSPSPSPSPKPTATPTPSVAISPSPSPKPTGPQEIIVEALDKITIQITIDNTPQKDVELSADQIMTFKAKSKIKLITPSGGALSIIHNGKELGVPGNLGQPKTMVFPR